MYVYDNKEWRQTDLVSYLFKKCIDTFQPIHVTPSRNFQVFDETGQMYNFNFKFSFNHELLSFKSEKLGKVDKIAPFRYYIENDRRCKFFNTKQEVVEYCKEHPAEFFRLQVNGEKKETFGVEYDKESNTLIINRKPYKLV